MKVKSFTSLNKNGWNEVRNQIEDALNKVGKKMGVSFQIGSITYNTSGLDFHTKLTCTINDGSVSDEYASYKVQFAKRARAFGLQVEDFLGEFEYGGKTWKLIGWNTKGRVLAERNDKKQFYIDRSISIKNEKGKLVATRNPIDSFSFLR